MEHNYTEQPFFSKFYTWKEKERAYQQELGLSGKEARYLSAGKGLCAMTYGVCILIENWTASTRRVEEGPLLIKGALKTPLACSSLLLDIGNS